MRAQAIHDFGPAEVFTAAELPDPVPGPGQALIRVVAASVNPVDVKVRAGGRGLAPPMPAVLGCDVAGEIVALGPQTAGFAVGDRVFGCVGGVGALQGTYAQLVAADIRLLAHVPAGLSLREAAALPLVTITAWEGLTRAGVGPGTTTLIHGGAGGVGHVAVQLAKARGAIVHATVSSAEKAAIARDLGADVVINYRDEAPEAYVARLTGGRGYDVVFDATGGDDLAPAFAGARLNGQVVAIVSLFPADLTLMHLKGLTLHVVFMLIPMLHDVGRAEHGAILRAAAELAASGRLRPVLDPCRFALDEVVAAHRTLESGAARGKIVLDIASA